MDALMSESKEALSQFLHSCSKAREGKQKELSYQLRCLECGTATTPVPACECRGQFDYIAPGELAEWAIKTYPDKSDRVIAEKFGISDTTVLRARKATASNEAVEHSSSASNEAPVKRTGKDGKTRRMPRKKSEPSEPAKERAGRRGQSMPQLDRAREIVRPLMDAGKPFQCHSLEREHGISHYTFDSAIAAEKARLETLAEVGAIADISKMTAKQKLDAAIRAHKKLLDREYDQRRIKEIGEHIKRIMPTLQEDKNKAFRAEQTYREYMQKAKKAMTVAEFTLVCSLLHPDSRTSASEGRLMRAFQMFEPKKFILTGEK